MIQIIPYSHKYKGKVLRFIRLMYHEFNDEVCTSGYDKDLLDIPGTYQKCGQFWICINQKEDIVGTFAFRYYSEDNKILELKRFYVSKKLRGTGMSGNLFKKSGEFLKKNPCESVILWSDIRYKRAHGFFRKMGFEIVAKRNMNDAFKPYTEYCFKNTANHI